MHCRLHEALGLSRGVTARRAAGREQEQDEGEYLSAERHSNNQVTPLDQAPSLT